MDICLPKFDIYQCTVASNCHTHNFQKKKKKKCLVSNMKFTLSDAISFLMDICLDFKKVYVQA